MYTWYGDNKTVPSKWAMKPSTRVRIHHQFDTSTRRENRRSVSRGRNSSTIIHQKKRGGGDHGHFDHGIGILKPSTRRCIEEVFADVGRVTAWLIHQQDSLHQQYAQCGQIQQPLPRDNNDEQWRDVSSSKLDSGWDVFLTTDSLSQKMLVAPSIGMPNICSLYWIASIWSIAILRAMNSEPKVDDSTVFCRLENHTIGALLT